MSDTAEYTRLWEAVGVAEQALNEAKDIERVARSKATACENAVIQARKAFVDYLVTRCPEMADEITKRRRLHNA